MTEEYLWSQSRFRGAGGVVPCRGVPGHSVVPVRSGATWTLFHSDERPRGVHMTAVSISDVISFLGDRLQAVEGGRFGDRWFGCPDLTG